MDSKRKVNGGGAATGEDLNGRAAKRRKLPSDGIDLSEGETGESTTYYGLKLLETLKKTEDKTGRLAATHFLRLPDKRQFPDYYEVTKMPIAFDTIEAKLKRGDFPTLTTLESYCKRMVQNAKEYNVKGSLVYDDAERIRKALSNFMTRTNPAYTTISGYTAFPTPLPTEAQVDGPAGETGAEVEPDGEDADNAATKRRGKSLKLPRQSATPARSLSSGGFEGLTFQQAQEKIVGDMIESKEYKDDPFRIFEPFVELPDRKEYEDYYQIIPQPMSLDLMQKRIKGITGKGDIGGVSDFKTWTALEEDMSLLWKNAFHYNEDDSPLYALAKDLKNFFSKLLKEAKKLVPQPSAPKIKLNISEQPKYLLKFPPGGKASPAESPAPQTNGSNGSSTPGPNGTASRRNPFGGSLATSTHLSGIDQLNRQRSTSGSVASPTPSNSALVKNEEAARNSPAISGYNNYRGTSQTVSTPGMPPPSTPGLPTSNMHNSGGYAQSFQHQHQYVPPSPNYEFKWRQTGQDASDALITNLSLATHPQLNIARHFRMELPPSPNMTHQSVTINLPSTHYYLQLKPTIAASIFDKDRQYKLFASVNGVRLHAMPTIPGHGVDQRHPLFEARLSPGVNRIEVELIAALPAGVKPSPGHEFDLEKTTIFANLMK